MVLVLKFKNETVFLYMMRYNNHTKISLLIIVIGILLRFSLVIVYHPSGDACYHFSIARFIAENGKIPFMEMFGRDEPFWAPPLFHIITAFFYNIFLSFSYNTVNFWIKFISPFFGSATLILTFLLAKRFKLLS